MSYKHITFKERQYIESMKANFPETSLRDIARKLGRAHTSISRECKKNTARDIGFYSALIADNIAKARRTAANSEKKMTKISDKIRNFIFEQLQERTSPEQICGRLKRVEGIRISHVTLYNYIELDKLQGGKLYLNLRHGVKKYRKSRTKDNTTGFNAKKPRIAQRPESAGLKQEPGHWEIDTVFGLLQQSYLLTLTDKATKFEIIRFIPNKEALTILNVIRNIAATSLLPFKTITSDNGTEFNLYEDIAKYTGAEYFFANPYSSWERGLNEHQNGLIRDFYPKGTDFNLVHKSEFRKIENNLNNRPRKSLGFLTPAEAMFNYVTFGTLVHLQL